jgi:hypothetical protein
LGLFETGMFPGDFLLHHSTPSRPFATYTRVNFIKKAQ